MADFKAKYPATSSTDITCTLASLAAGSSGVFTTGRGGAAVDNTANLDLDHLFGGRIRTGTSPTSGRVINVYVIAAAGSSSGSAVYPAQAISSGTMGSDSGLVFVSANAMNALVALAASIVVDSTSDRDYPFKPVSIASLFGDIMPKWWFPYVAHDTAVALNATGSNHQLWYERIQSQSV